MLFFFCFFFKKKVVVTDSSGSRFPVAFKFWRIDNCLSIKDSLLTICALPALLREVTGLKVGALITLGGQLSVRA